METRSPLPRCRLCRKKRSPRAALLRNDCSDTFFAYWTAKESCLKYLGAGLCRNPASFCVTLEGSRAGIAENPALLLRVYSDIPGYSAAVCSPCYPPARLLPVE